MTETERQVVSETWACFKPLAFSLIAIAAIMSMAVAEPIARGVVHWLTIHEKLAGWTQAFASVASIVGIYIAAVWPLREAARIRAEDKRLRAAGIALLILPDVLTLLGDVERAIDDAPLNEHRIPAPASLMRFVDQLYLLDEAGFLILQAIGILSGLSRQTDTVIAKMAAAQRKDIQEFWINNVETLKLAHAGLTESIPHLTRVSSLAS